MACGRGLVPLVSNETWIWIQLPCTEVVEDDMTCDVVCDCSDS